MPFSGGSGTQADPYLISTVDDLNLISDPLYISGYKYFKQTNDIEIGDFTPIGYSADYPGYVYFIGYYDGDNYSLKNGNIIYGTTNMYACNYIGIFANVRIGYIKNLTLDNINILASFYCGFLAGMCSGQPMVINNIIVKSNCVLEGSNYVGGIVGYFSGQSSNPNKTFYNNCNHGSVKGSSYVGGLIGYNLTVASNTYVFYMYNCYNTGSVYGSYKYVGGLIGYVFGDGGLGISSTFAMYYCYNSGNVSAALTCGGLIGCYVVDSSYSSFILRKCYSLCDSIIRLPDPNPPTPPVVYVDFHRIIGSRSTSNGYFNLDYNYALDTMTMPEYVTMSKGLTSIDGEDITSVNAKKLTTYINNGWDNTIWTIDENISYPFFKIERVIISFIKKYISGSFTEIQFKKYVSGNWVVIPLKKYFGGWI